MQLDAQPDLSTATTPPESVPPEPPPSLAAPDDFLQSVPEKHHDFAKVFPPATSSPWFHASIELEEGKTPHFGSVNHLSQ